MIIACTERLLIRHLSANDHAFILKLLNQRSFIENIGDRGVRNEQDAIEYIEAGPCNSYKEHSFGLNLVCLNASAGVNITPIGLCGMLKRPEFELPDLGYAILDEFAGTGYTYKACLTVLDHAKSELSLKRVCAITAPNNKPSNALLLKLGFSLDKEVEYQGQTNHYYALKL